MVLSDIAFQCTDCGAEFLFTVGEQEFHAARGFTNQPKRCTACCHARRGDWRSGGGGYNSGPREAFAIVCSGCGADATVPFRPTGDRPVYCSDCFSRMRS